MMFEYAEWRSVFIFFSVPPQYYEMSYGLNIEMHKQVCEPLIPPCLYTHCLWIMDSILDSVSAVCMWIKSVFIFFNVSSRFLTYAELTAPACVVRFSEIKAKHLALVS